MILSELTNILSKGVEMNIRWPPVVMELASMHLKSLHIRLHTITVLRRKRRLNEIRSLKELDFNNCAHFPIFVFAGRHFTVCCDVPCKQNIKFPF